MPRPKISHIKQAQRESFFRNELASCFLRIAQEDRKFSGWSINRTELGAKRSVCTVFFLCPGQETEFEQKLSLLLAYKPALRHWLSQVSRARRCPELSFRYDSGAKAQEQIEEILAAIKKEGNL